MAMTSVSNIKKKNVIDYKGEPHLVLECMIRTPPNNAAYCQMELRGIKTGRSFPVRSNTGQQYDVLNKTNRTVQFSYEDRGMYVFLDQTTYESYEIDREKITDVIDFLVLNQNYDAMFVDDNFTLIDLPSSITMRVEEAPDGLRGDTGGNATKTIKLETGLEIRAPLFIKKDEMIKVSTEDKTYQGRA
jgi:elongation factor P